MSITNVPSISQTLTGWVAPSQSAILAGVQADINAAFGGGLNFGTQSAGTVAPPQGQLSVTQTAIVGNTNDLLLSLFNGVDPAFASGRMQDAIARIYFLTRNPARSTVVQATCSGLAGVVIPADTLALAGDGNLYACTTAGTMPASGSMVLSFACLNQGAIACPAATLTTVYQAIPGWDSITNLEDGVIGSVVESRADFENRRRQSVALNALGTTQAILGAVLSVPDVVSAYVFDNANNSPVQLGSVQVKPNSLFVCVSGGAAQDVAKAIWSKKAPGCSYTGNTTLTVYDNSEPYPAPGIPYSVTFEMAANTEIYFNVTLLNSSAVPSSAVTLIQHAILHAFIGADGGTRAQQGSTILASRYYAGITALGPWAALSALTLGAQAEVAPISASTATSIATSTAVTMQVNQMPVTSVSNITVNFI